MMQNLHRALGRQPRRGGRLRPCCRFAEVEARSTPASAISAGTVLTAERSRGMVSHNGTLGVQLLRTQQFEYDWPPGSRVVMHSDGMSARWSVASYPGLQHAASRRHRRRCSIVISCVDATM